jgi:hypothetical protein
MDVDHALVSSSRSSGGVEVGGGGQRCVSGGNGDSTTIEHFALSAGMAVADGFAGISNGELLVMTTNGN